MSNVQHSSESELWYTPLPIVAAARAALGTIDLDPASDAFGNTRVGAGRYVTEGEDGLIWDWAGSIFLNPPGGTMPDPAGVSKRAVSKAGLFWKKLMATLDAGRLTHAVYVAFSLEQLSSTQRGGRSCAHFTLCIPSSRLRFDTPSGAPGASPSHANAIVYVPGTVDRTVQFVAAFQHLGAVLRPFHDDAAALIAGAA